MSDLNLKLDVLEALESVGTIGMPTRTVVNQVQLTSRPTPTLTQVEEILRKLEAEHLVVALADELDRGVVIWTVTGRGQAQLRARGR